jgi:N-hydroxyarylamine O-acetyltransferase
MIDFDAYLHRIGLDPADKPPWQAIHRAHVTTIPFENLDPHRGIPVSLEQADLERKLVASRRGGYCFEHNLLLASALAHMGLEVEPMLARARVGGAPRETRPATHLVLRVTGAGRQWQADVGFGLGTLLDPIPFGPAGVHEQSGWSFTTSPARCLPWPARLTAPRQRGPALGDPRAACPAVRPARVRARP